MKSEHDSPCHNLLAGMHSKPNRSWLAPTHIVDLQRRKPRHVMSPSLHLTTEWFVRACPTTELAERLPVGTLGSKTNGYLRLHTQMQQANGKSMEQP